ncbi:MAG: alpha/beta fold hydrolase [Alphaproteobacteria bacterium]|nr:alpha/beta fold hydrolase [Alphaproteobacteria bacterium]
MPASASAKSLNYKVNGGDISLSEKRLSFRGSADTLAGILTENPDGARRGVAVYAHCFTCGKDIAASRAVSRGLAARGITTLRFDFTGIGDSGGDFASSTFTNNCRDILAAADFLASEGFKPDIFVGHSLGGAAAISAAAHTPDIKGVVAIGSPAKPGHALRLFEPVRDEVAWRGQGEVSIGGRTFSISGDFLDDFETQCSEGVVSRLGCDFLVLHSPRDDTVGIENAATLFGWARHPKSFVSLGDFGHLLAPAHESDYVAELISGWASRFLGSGAAATAPAKTAKAPAPASASSPDDGGVEVVESLPLGDLRQEVRVRGHSFVVGEPVPIGDDSGPTPYDVLLAGLGSCTAMTLRMYAKRKGLSLERVRVKLWHGRRHADDCERADGAAAQIEEVRRVVELEGDLSETERARLLEIADKCPVHRTLTGDLSIKTELSD